MNMEESKGTPTFANDGHCQRCLVAEVEFPETFYERFNNWKSSNMHMADLDSAIAQKCKEIIKENINFPGRSGLLVSSLVGAFILKVWSYLC